MIGAGVVVTVGTTTTAEGVGSGTLSETVPSVPCANRMGRPRYA